MTMRQVTYLQPPNLQKALQVLEEQGDRARILAGGTDLINRLRKDMATPDVIVDISRIDEIRGIRLTGDAVWIGALTTHSEIRNSRALAGAAPLIVEACREVGSVQIRNRGTLGGNLGNASPAGDSIPALTVLGAEVEITSSRGARWVPIDEFFIGPGKTICRPDEMITALCFGIPKAGSISFFQKIGQRRAVRVSKVSAAGYLEFEGNQVSLCRLALGAVAPTVIRLPQSEAAVAGKPLQAETIALAAKFAGQLCSPINDFRSTVEYRCHISSVLVKRGLNQVLMEVKNGRK